MISSSILPTFPVPLRHSPFVSRSVGSLMSFTSFPRPSGRDRRERNEERVEWSDERRDGLDTKDKYL